MDTQVNILKSIRGGKKVEYWVKSWLDFIIRVNL